MSSHTWVHREGIARRRRQLWLSVCLYGRYRLGTVCLCHPQQLLDSDFTGGRVRRANRSWGVGESRSGFFRWHIVRFVPCRRALPSCSVLDGSHAKCAHLDRIPWHVYIYRFPRMLLDPDFLVSIRPISLFRFGSEKKHCDRIL